MGAHLHLLVNHVPILGVMFALGLLIASLFVARDVLGRTALVVLAGVAIGAALANFTGEPAEDAIRRLPEFSRSLVHDHEEAAEIALISSAILGVLAVIALVRWRRTPLPRAVIATGLAFTMVVSLLMGYTGLLGGRINHPEVRSATLAPPAAATTAP
jgi:uncharacterized membrane protein